MPNYIQKVLVERLLNNVGKIHNEIKTIIEGGNQNKADLRSCDKKLNPISLTYKKRSRAIELEKW